MTQPLTPDACLVERMAAGDRGAGQELAERHRLSVYARVYAMLIDPGAAEQVVVQTFDQAWRSAREFKASAASPLAWLVGIARGLAERRKRWMARSDSPIEPPRS
ncbi:MAG: hypothetical protein DMD31_01085 [Gemmatimonadetes bacterium]|nr:MAG: hypothetical protein DMD31_01085 [Gemmatimonadota bacterium]